MEGVERVFDVVFKGDRGHVVAVATVSLGQSEVFHSVNEMHIAVAAGRRLDDKSPIIEDDEASAERAAAVGL